MATGKQRKTLPMKTNIISALIGALVQLLTPEMLRGFIDAGLDWIENYVMETDNTIDDSIVLPICRKLREAVGIPDEDGNS